jgi:hypothetical protein
MGRQERRGVPKYRLKILCEIVLPLRDDLAARLKAKEVLALLGIDLVNATLGIGPAQTTLVCEEAKDGRNLLPPDPTS